MALNPNQSGDSHNWNYTKPDNPGFSLELTGTVAAIQEVQAMEFDASGRPTKPKFWDNGQPMWNIRMVIVGPKGGFRTWTFTPASKAAKEGKKKSVHIDLFNLSAPAEVDRDMMKLIGRTIHIKTEAPPKGFNYGVGNPRPWFVEEIPGVRYELSEPLPPIYQMAQVLADGAVSGGVINTPAAPVGHVTPEMQAQMDANNAAAAQGQAPAPQPTSNVPGAPGSDEDIPF